MTSETIEQFLFIIPTKLPDTFFTNENNDRLLIMDRLLMNDTEKDSSLENPYIDFSIPFHRLPFPTPFSNIDFLPTQRTLQQSVAEKTFLNTYYELVNKPHVIQTYFNRDKNNKHGVEFLFDLAKKRNFTGNALFKKQLSFPPFTTTLEPNFNGWI